MKHVLVTGGSGFIGSHLCDVLLKRGYAVTAVDNFITGRKENLTEALNNPNFQLLEWDVCEAIPEDRLKFLGRDGLHGVLHFACPASPVDFDRIPFEILSVDSLGTMHTVKLAIKYAARYVLASTSEAYGDPLVHPQPESYWGNVNPIGPRACYDETKRFAEAYVSTAIRGVVNAPAQSKLDGGIVRIFNTYGPRMRPDDGRIVPELIMQALRGKPLSIHGDGKQTRSFCFVSDLVDGVVRLFESKFPGPVNIGNPVENSVLEFAQAVKDCTGGCSELQYLPARPDDPRKRCPDISTARKLLGWEPKVKLKEGLKISVEYFKSTLEG